MLEAICCLRLAPKSNLLFAFYTLMQLPLCILHLNATSSLHLAPLCRLIFALLFPFHL